MNIGKVFVMIYSWSLNIPDLTSIREVSSWISNSNGTIDIMVESKISLVKDLYKDGVMKYEALLQNIKRKLIITDKLSGNVTSIEFVKLSTLPKNTKANIALWQFVRNSVLEFTLKEEYVDWSRVPFDHTVFCRNMVINIETNGSRLAIISTQCLSGELSEKIDNYNFAKVLISYIGFSLSIISLFSLIVFNRKLGKHKSVAGSNLENVCLALLASTSLFVVGIGLNDHPIACKAMAVSLHYSWLTVFSFKSIAVACIISKIQNLEARNTDFRDDTFKTKICFLIVGLGLPFMFVVPLTILAQKGVLLYHKQNHLGICFQTAFLANLIFCVYANNTFNFIQYHVSCSNHYTYQT